MGDDAHRGTSNWWTLGLGHWKIPLEICVELDRKIPEMIGGDKPNSPNGGNKATWTLVLTWVLAKEKLDDE